LTGHGSRQIDVAAMNAGATDYLDKLELTPSILERSIRYAVEHARIERELEVRSLGETQQRRLAEALLDTTAALNSTLDLDEVLGRILANIGIFVPYDAANIMLLEAGMARVVDCRGDISPVDERMMRTKHFDVFNMFTLRKIIETNQALVISDTLLSDLWLPFRLDQIRSYIGVPIAREDEVIGFINLESYSACFYEESHLQHLQSFAHQAAIAIQNAQAYQQVQKLTALEERQRLARDLHDSVTQTLFSASMIAGSLEHLIESDAAAAMSNARKLARMTSSALAEMRMLLMELRSPELDQADLGALLQHLAATLTGRMEAQVNFNITGTKFPIPDAARIAISRMAQEALNNIGKHAGACHVMLDLKYAAPWIEVRVMDDGPGFDIESVDAGRMGLRIMRERAESIHASLSVTSARGHGTRVIIRWSEEIPS